MAWYIWLLLGAVLCVLEILTPSFVSMGFGIGAFAAALVSFLHGDLTLQLLLFIVVSALFTFVMVRFSKNRSKASGTDALIGKIAILSEDVDPVKDTGRALLDGQDWKVKSFDGSSMKMGEEVVVVSLQGVSLVVMRR